MPTSGADIGREKQWNPFKVLINMRREAPGFKRCCLCLPLRRGLITWGYIKLALDTLVIASLIYILANVFYIMFIVEIVITFFDAGFSIVLIVGGHQKSVRLLKVAYIYNMVYLGLLMATCVWAVYQELRLVIFLAAITSSFKTILWISLPGLCLQFIQIFVQIYFILLLRSEKQKLEEQSVEMQFTNPSAAEAQCTMHESVGRSEESDQRSDGGQSTGNDE